MKTVPKYKVIYSFSPKHTPAEYVKPEELVLLETEDALGGQVKDERFSLDKLDWSSVNGATGPIFIEGAQPKDTLVVDILEIKIRDKGVIVTIPNYGVLGSKNFEAVTKVVTIKEGFVLFENKVRVKANPMIGTIGVAPETGEVPSSIPGRHGGNMDIKELTTGTRLYLPVFVNGALFAAGDLHAVQADGELCVSAIEVAGQILLRLSIIKGKSPKWPILETHDYYAFLTSADTLDEASTLGVEAAVEALMREHNWSFEKAYMFGSLAVDLKINQAVDPQKGVRTVLPKGFISINSLIV
jgi:amidase